MIFHEAPHKLRATLEDLRETFGPDRRVALCRELTKLHEETVRTTLGEAAAYYQENTPKGEYVLVVAGSPPRETAAVTLEEGTEQVLRLVAQGIRLKDAAREVSAHTGLSKNELYAAALERSCPAQDMQRRRRPCGELRMGVMFSAHRALTALSILSGTWGRYSSP